MEEAKRGNSYDQKGLIFSRRFTDPSINPLDVIEYEKRESVVLNRKDPTKKVFHMTDVEVPKFWSQLATDIIAEKYFRKKGVPGLGVEKSARAVVERIAGHIRSYGELKGYFASKEDADTFESELLFLLINQYGAFNSPVWFNVGLSHKYDITGEAAGNWIWDDQRKEVVKAKDGYSRPQSSACFIQAVEDSLKGMMKLQRSESLLFKFGSGTGTNFSTIRGRGESLSGGGASSGLISFLGGFNAWAGAIKSGGTTRRAAKMVILNYDHPEIKDFINWKARSEKLVQILVEHGGEDSDFESTAYESVPGQNSNNTVRVDDKFMQGIVDDNNFFTFDRVNKENKKEISCRELMLEISKACHRCGDPGLQFDDNINKMHTCKNSGRINASNPCSEYMFLDNSACNLASLNLVRFLKADNKLDLESLKYAVDIFITAQEILVGLASYPTKEINQNSEDFRPLGLGYANLGSLIMLNGLAYDSDKARTLAAAITAIVTGRSYVQSAKMAGTHIGTFNKFGENRHVFLEVMNIHKNSVDDIESFDGTDYIIGEAGKVWEEVIALGERNGFRNAQTTVLAPTGTISFLMDCDTTGIEPDFALNKFKKLAGGGMMKIVNQSVGRALRNLRYSESEIQGIMDYIEKNNFVEKAPHLKEEHYAIFDTANKPKGATRIISPDGHVKMMAAVQPFVSGAISKTVNLPEETTIDEIESIYIDAWKRGLKAVALYRDNSKFSQPLNVEEDKKKIMVQWGSKKRPGDRRLGFTQKISVGGTAMFIRTGEYENGELAEVFIDIFKGGSDWRTMINNWAVSLSNGLQYGWPLRDMIYTYINTQSEPRGMVRGYENIKTASSVPDLVMRILGIEYLGMTELATQPEKVDKSNLWYIRNKKVTELFEKEKGGDEDNGDTEEKPMTMESDGGPPCKECGGTTVKTGSCWTCVACGANEGCG